MARLSKGELFYPYGLNVSRSSFGQTVEAVLWVLSSLDKEVDPSYPDAICNIHYDLHFRATPVHKINQGVCKHYIHNYFEMRNTFRIYEIDDVKEFYRDKRKIRSVSLLGEAAPVDFDSLFYATTYHPYNLTSKGEPRMHPHHQSRDWRLVLARVLKNYYQFEVKAPLNECGVVLSFTRK